MIGQSILVLIYQSVAYAFGEELTNVTDDSLFDVKRVI